MRCCGNEDSETSRKRYGKWNIKEMCSFYTAVTVCGVADT